MDELAQKVHNITISQAATSNNKTKRDNENKIGICKNSTNVTYQITHDYTKLPKDQPSLNVLYANVKSIKKKGKIDELKCILKMIPKPVHLILLTETWTKTDDSNAESLELENYHLVLSNRAGKVGGGAGAYILRGIKYSTEGIYKNGNNYLWVFLEELRLNVGVIYYPGNTGEKTFLGDIKLQLEKQRGRRAIALGDFNINLLEDDKSKDYQKTLSDTGFVILNNKSKEYFTRKDIRNNIEKKISIIDHVCSNLDAGDYHFALIDSSLADHRQVYIEIKNPELLPKDRKGNETIKQSPRKSLSVVKNSAPSGVLKSEKCMIEMINKTESQQLNQDNWITEKICKRIALRNLLYQKYQRNPNNETQKQFDKANKKEYEEREVKKSEHTILTLIKNGFNKKVVPSKLSTDSKTITDSKEICEQFNSYFSEITGLNQNPRDHNNIPSDIANSTKENNQLNRLSKMAPCTSKEISEIIVSLDPYASAGIDGIHAKSIKGCNKDNICNNLSTCINNCFDAGYFPDCLKISKVMPVHKSGWKGKLKNYTFELALPVFSKILEKLLWRRLNCFVPIHYVTENQYGYREKPNTVSPTIDLVSKINTSIDKKEIVLGLFIDLNEALNKVSHSLILKKVESLGINDLALQILKSYFVNRKYIVAIRDFESNPRDIKQGVPQGSILGHLLFLIYTNAVLKLKLNGDITLSSEKITLFYYGVNVENLLEKAQQDLNTVSKWFQDSGLVMNPKEIHNVIFTNKTKIDRTCKLYLSGIEIAEATQAEYFGLILDSKLSWKPHVLKIMSILRMFHENLKTVGRCSQRQGLVFYNACIRPYIDYLIEVWGTAAVASKTLLQGPHTTLKCKLNAAIILSMKQNIFYKTCILVYKIIHRGITQLSFKVTEDVTSRDTRNKNLLWVATKRTKYGQQILSYAGALAFNGLPEDIRNADSICIFKKKLRSHLGFEKKHRHQKPQAANEARSAPAKKRSDEVRKSEDNRNNVVYKCTKCDTDELFKSPSQRKKHRDTKHPEVAGRKQVFRRL